MLFGHEPKIGLTSTSLPASIFDNITTEEELLNHLDLPAGDPNLVEKDENQSEVEQDTNSEEDEVPGEKDEVDEENDREEKMILRNDRVKRTNEIRQVDREGQKRQADEFLQNTQKKQKLANLAVGDNVVSFS